MENQRENNYNIINPDRTGKFIKDIRLYHNMTQDDLADLLYITRKAVSKWETGAGYPSIDVAKRLCDTFGISFEELIAGKYIEKNKRLVFNSAIYSTIMILLVLFLTLYKDYLNKFDIYKYSFQSKSINIVNNKIMISKKHKIYSFGSLNVNDNSVSTKTKFKLNLFLKENHNRLLYTCIYYNNKCHKRYVNTKLTKKELSNNLKNIFLTVTYKDKNGNVVSLAEQNLKINTNGNGTKRVLPNNTFVEPYLKLNDSNEKQINPILYDINNRINLQEKNKEIDLSFLYDMTNKELYKKYNRKIIHLHNRKYKVFVHDKSIYISINKNSYFNIKLKKNIISMNINNQRTVLSVNSKHLIINNYENDNFLIVKILEILKEI